VETVAVDVIDRTMWLAMQRFAASGVLQFTHQSRLLHRATALAEPVAQTSAPLTASRGELIAEGQRSLRKAKLLASGGFAEEAPALLAMVVRKAAAARMAERSELDAGASRASDTDIRRLVEQGVFPREAFAILDASQPSAATLAAADLDVLLASAEQILVAVAGDAEGTAEPGLRAA
jgi:hypothetical protein